MTDLQTILSAYAAAHHLTSLNLVDRRVKIWINDDLPLVIEEKSDHSGFYLFSIVTEINADREKLFEMALKANVFHRETGMGTLGYEEQTNALVYFDLVSLNPLTLAQFEERLGHFIQYLTFLTEKFAKASHAIDPMQIRDLPDSKQKIFYA